MRNIVNIVHDVPIELVEYSEIQCYAEPEISVPDVMKKLKIVENRISTLWYNEESDIQYETNTQIIKNICINERRIDIRVKQKNMIDQYLI